MGFKRLYKKVPIFFVLLFFSSYLLIGAIPVSAATTDPVVDLKRRRIRAAILCTQRNDAIDTDDDVWSDTADYEALWNDVIRGGDAGGKERIVTGFELDDVNGVVTCRTALPRGVEAAELNGYGVDVNNRSSAREYLVRHYTDLQSSSFEAGHHYDVINGDNDRSEVLEEGLQAVLDNNYEGPNNQLRVVRFVGLVQICFSGLTDESADINEGHGDFRVSGLGTFHQRDDLDFKSLGWIHPGGVGIIDPGQRVAKIGDIQLGFNWNEGINLPGNLFSYEAGKFYQADDDRSSDFYPIGNDISPPGGENYTADDSIVDCHFVKKYKSLVFAEPERWSFDSNGVPQYRAPDGIQIVRPGGGGDTEPTPGDDEGDTCEENFDFAFSWLVCAVIGLVDGVVNEWLDAVTGMLEVDGAEVNRPELRKAWSYFRNIASLLLVVIGLVMIIGQAGSRE